jgi:hypothetical protein
MKIFLQSIVVTLFVLAMSMPVDASDTGNDLASKCLMDEGDKLNLMYCLGLVRGFADAWTVLSPTSFCLPKESTTGQLVKVITKYMDEHPEGLHDSYGLQIVKALKKAFPCKETGPNVK